MAITPEITEETLRVYRQTRSPFKAAQKVGISVSDVFEIINNNEEKLTAVPERHGGMGRPELRQHLVARRKASATEWNNADPKIKLARANYEKGTHIMTTGRDGGWVLLFSIPRKGRPDPMPGYFIPEVA